MVAPGVPPNSYKDTMFFFILFSDGQFFSCYSPYFGSGCACPRGSAVAK